VSENISPSTTIELKNDHISVKVEKLPDCIAKLHILVSPLASQAAYANAIKSVGKEVSIPGFRKGKAPTEVIKKNYSKFIDKEWEDKLLRTSFSEALALANLSPYRENSVKTAKFIKKSKETESEVFVEFEYAPEIPTIQINGITLTSVQPQPITDESVDAELMAMQLSDATWEPLNDKVVEEGDYVDLDISAVDNPSELLCEDTRFIVNKDQMSSWMLETLLGLKAGETKVGTNDQIPDESIKKNAENGHEPLPYQFNLTVKSILKPILPEINDEFAKKFQAESAEDLKDKIRRGLTRQAEENAKSDLRNQVLKQLLEKYSFDIPSREYNAEKKIQIKRLHSKIENNELSQLEKLRLLQEADNYTKNLPDNYRLFFLAKQFSRQHGLNVTQQELYDAVLQQLIASQTSPNSLIDQTMDPDLMHSLVYNHLILEKAVDYIVKQAQFV
jgi:trigger factor